MCDNLSQMYSSIYLTLGQPDDSLLSRLELANILFRRISYRLESVRQSPQREAIAKTAEFTLGDTEDEVDLTALDANLVIPLWCESKLPNYQGNPVWQFVPNVNLSMLPEQRTLGVPACSFYGENPREVNVKFSFFGNELWTPSQTMRVWYAPTITFPTSELATIELPENLVNMVQYDALVSALPLMITNGTAQLTKRPELKEMVGAWKFLLDELKVERAEFERYFEMWRRKSRGAQRPTMRTDILPQILGRRGARWTVNNSGSV